MGDCQHEWELATGDFLRDHISYHGTGRYAVALKCKHCAMPAVAIHSALAKPLIFEGRTIHELPQPMARYVP